MRLRKYAAHDRVRGAVAPQDGPHRKPMLGRGKNISYYMAGEYGDNYGRPHYHAAIFNVDWADKVYFSKTQSGFRLYTSELLTKLWGHGHATTGAVTFQSAAYIARYVMKKITGNKAAKHYERINPDTGEIYQLTPEYNQMSRKRGIGKAWLEKFHRDVYPHGTVLVNGVKSNPPRYYDNFHKDRFPDDHEDLQFRREMEAALRAPDNTDDRLAVKEVVTKAAIKQLKRTIK